MSTLPDPPIHIAYLGETGFPYGLASIQRQLLVSRGLVHAGARVLVVSNKGVLDLEHATLSAEGEFQGVQYVYTSGEVCRRQNFFSRNFYKAKGVLNEFLLIRQLSSENKLDFALVATMRFHQQLFYYLLSKLFGFKTLLNLVEKNSAIPTRTRMRERINDHFIDLWSIELADGVLPISNYLEQLVDIARPGKPSLRIPILSDFDQEEIRPSVSRGLPRYFLYCGSATYIELIDFIIETFEKINLQNIHLHLVISGDPSEMDLFRAHLERSAKRAQIRFFTRLSYPELIKQYDGAAGLLIPLRPSIQDQARFPHKIGEYLASGNPMITTAYGEITQYFIDGKNALIADQFDPEQFAAKMRFVINNPEEAKEIGKAGKILAEREFDYKKHGQNLLAFMKSLST